MRITVLGADGFLGRELVSSLSKNRDVSILAFSRFSSLSEDSRKTHPFTALGNVTIVPGDIQEKNDVEKAIEGADYVFHLASSTTPASSTKDPLVDIETNVKGTIEVLDLCSKHNVKKFVFFSSGGAVYGDVDDDNIKETSPLRPLSPYGIGKVTIEHYLEYFHRTQGLDYIIYRIANPYGPTQKVKGGQGVIPIFMRHVLDHDPITVLGDGEMVRDYIYIDDLINMVGLSFDKKTRYKIYNLGSGKGTSVNKLVEVLEKCNGSPIDKMHLEAPATFVQRNVLSIDRFVGEFAVAPAISLDEGIERTWNYVRENA